MDTPAPAHNDGLIGKNVLLLSHNDVNQKSSFLRKITVRYNRVLVVTEFVVSGTQCTSRSKIYRNWLLLNP